MLGSIALAKGLFDMRGFINAHCTLGNHRLEVFYPFFRTKFYVCHKRQRGEN